MIAVLAMHGLTMNHDAAMASMRTVSPITVVSPRHLDPMTGADAIPSAAYQAVVMPASGTAFDGTTVSRVGTEPPADAVTVACVAFLAGLVLLVGAGRMVGRVRLEANELLGRQGVAWFATAVDRLRPDLGELSVLRT